MSNTKLVIDVTNTSDRPCVLPATPPTLAGVGADGSQVALPSNGDGTYFGAPPPLKGPLPADGTAVVWVGGGQPGVCDPLDATQTWNGMALGLPDGATLPFTTAFDTKCGISITRFGTSSPPPAAPGLAVCTSANLTLTVSPLGEPSVGQQQAQIAFTNTGTTACVLDGHPGVSVTDEAGNQIGASALRTDRPTPTITLAANGGTAVAGLLNLYQTVYDDGCVPRQATMLKVYPPDETVALSTPFAITVCSNAALAQLTVDVVNSTGLTDAPRQACTGSNLAAQAGPTDGAMGTVRLDITIANRGPTCILPTTPPELTGIDSTGKAVPLPPLLGPDAFFQPPALDGPLVAGGTAVVWVWGDDRCDPGPPQRWSQMLLGFPHGTSVPFTTPLDTHCGINSITRLGSTT